MPYLGIDLGGTKLTAAASTDDGELLHREATPRAGRRLGGTARGHVDNVGTVGTMAFVALVWMTITTVAEILAEAG